MAARRCEHTEVECVPCFKERIGSIGLGSGCTPSRDNTDWDRRRKIEPKNSWERGKPVDHRGMPYLDANGERLTQKEFAESRHKYRQHQKPIDVKAS